VDCWEDFFFAVVFRFTLLMNLWIKSPAFNFSCQPMANKCTVCTYNSSWLKMLESIWNSVLCRLNIGIHRECYNLHACIHFGGLTEEIIIIIIIMMSEDEKKRWVRRKNGKSIPMEERKIVERSSSIIWWRHNFWRLLTPTPFIPSLCLFSFHSLQFPLVAIQIQSPLVS